MLLGPALMAALAFPQMASHASTASDPTRTTAVGVQETATLPQQDGDYDRGYARGLRQGLRDGRTDCGRRPEFAYGEGEYWQGWADGYEAGYSRYCG
jgi:hypothetical protein